MKSKAVDLITFEILQHRLWQISQEMAISLKRVTGSPVTIDAKDFMVGLFDGEGNLLASGAGVLYHAVAFRFGIRHLIEKYGKDPGINEGDVFLINDPYISCLHKPDAAIFTPIYYKGERVGWAATMTHLVDIGGMGIGGKSAKATNILQEGFNFQGIKIAEGGKLRRDVIDSIISMSRDPAMVGLDIRGELAAGEVARKRVLEIIEEHGLDVYKAVCQEIIKYSETLFKARLREIPDGTWRTTLYLDDDGVTDKIYKIVLNLTKSGEHLHFDFTGTDGQAPSYMNCSPVGGRAAVFAALAPILAYDIPWSQGICNCYDAILPEGSLISSKFPAPCGSASLGGAYYVMLAGVHAISKMLHCSDKHKEDATAIWGLTGGTIFIAAQTQKGSLAVIVIMDIEGVGGGARTYADGVDVAGNFLVPEGSVANVEVYEERYPFLYLFRRQRMDTGGAGKFRGGVGMEGAFTLHGSPTGKADSARYGSGAEVPVPCGLAGGYPGSNLVRKLVKGSDINSKFSKGELPQQLEELKGELSEISVHGDLEFKMGDVYYYGQDGGGGYGDPLERDVSLVAEDVKNGLVSLECAAEVYGAILQPDTLEIDEKRTGEKREAIRQIRARAKKDTLEVRDIAWCFEPGVISGKRAVKCPKCGYLMPSDGDGLRVSCLSRNRSLKEISPAYSRSNRVSLKEYYCPGCLSLVHVEVVVKDSGKKRLTEYHRQ